ncbi:MAG: ATP-binding protein [Actinobacteria bacterium]|nr:ATP-binding protein [Actinomycetota bacterium]
MLNRDDYIATAEALHACVEARVPVILWGPPGQGKTSVIRDLAVRQQRHIEILLASIREPQDFAGLPSIYDGAMSLIPPNWAARLRDDGNGILFTDEVNTAPPAVQAALLRVCLDKVAGDCELGERTSIIAAANPPEQAADGWDLAPPLANRFCHLDWSLPSDVVRDGLAGQWPVIEMAPAKPAAVEAALGRERIMVAGFLTGRPDLTTVLPKATSEQGRAFPTPRSWEMAITVGGWSEALGLDATSLRMLIRGCVGQGASAEYLTYRDNLDLPDPESLLAAPTKFKPPKRADQVYVIGAGVLAVVRNNTTEARWHAAGQVLERIASAGNPDIAVAFARDWLKMRPGDAMPDSALLKALIPLLQEAKMI